MSNVTEQADPLEFPANEINQTVSAPAPTHRVNTVEFSGKGGEFFGIWIVNILLTIVTLGIYSAWAKVRTLQYFYGHTKVDGHSFRYLATPIQILKGRLIAFAIIALLSVGTHISPIFALVFAVAAIFGMPWLLVQGIKFNLRMTAYRNVRFGFHGTYGQAMLNFVLMPILAVFTFYLLMPYVLKRMDHFIYNNISFGGRKLTVNNEGSKYYEAAIITFVASVGGMIALVIILMIFGFSGAALGGGNVDNLGPIAGAVMFILTMVGYIAILTVSQAIYRSMIRNHVFAKAEFEGLATFKSQTTVSDYAALIFTNYAMIACTLGLAYPVTKVRTALYLAQNTQVSVNPAIDDLTDPLKQDSSTLLEEAADLYDIDFSLT